MLGVNRVEFTMYC